MDGTRIKLAYGCITGIHVASLAILIAKTPKDDARMIAVAKHHAHITVHESGGPRRVARQAVVAVAFKVCFVHHEEAVGIEHGIHLRLARIVAGAHGVDVGLLHQSDVAKHGGHIDITAIERMGIVDIRPFEEDALAVDGHIFVCLCVDELDVAEAVFSAEDHFLLLAIELADDDIVEIWFLCIPGMEAFQQFGGQVDVGACASELHLLLLLCNDFTLGIKEFKPVGAATVQACAIVDVECHIEATALAIGALAQDRNDMVADERLRLGYETDIAMDTAQSPHILPFEV